MHGGSVTHLLPAPFSRKHLNFSLELILYTDSYMQMWSINSSTKLIRFLNEDLFNRVAALIKTHMIKLLHFF